MANKLTDQTRAFSSLTALLLKLTLAVLSIPLIISLTLSFKDAVFSLGVLSFQYFVGGIISYLILHFFIYRPASFYKRGQDILRFLFRFFSPLLKIAPYLLPIYSILIIVCFLILNLVFRLKLVANNFLFFISFSLVFHLILTAEDLRDRQAGLARANYFFGFIIIYLLNLLMIAAGLHFMFGKFSFLEFLRQSSSVSLSIYQSIFSQLFA